jgi:hypothetical protein
MANIRRNKNTKVDLFDQASPPDGPAWLDRVRGRLQGSSLDAARKIFLERAFDAVIDITNALPSKSLEEPAAAETNMMVLFRALQSPAILKVLELHEPLASPYLQGLAAQQDLVRRAGGLVSGDEAAKILGGLTRQAIDKRRQAGKLIAVPQGQRGYGYPMCQFDRKGVVAGLESILAALGDHDGWMQLIFLLNPNSVLADAVPLELLRRGLVDEVENAATNFGTHGAQ